MRSYGEQRFVDDVLAVTEGKPAPQTLLTTFRPLRVEPHLGGAWLVYRDSDQVSLAAAANGVGLSFYHRATLTDPDHLLQGAGKQNRFIRLPSVEALRLPGVLALIKQAVERAPLPLPRSGGGSTIILFSFFEFFCLFQGTALAGSKS
jgi:hypothetical protein